MLWSKRWRRLTSSSAWFELTRTTCSTQHPLKVNTDFPHFFCFPLLFTLFNSTFALFLKLDSQFDLSDDQLTACLLSYLLTYLLTPWCRVLLEQLTDLQLVNKFTAFHGTRRFITALTSVRHLSLSWASPILSIYPHPTSWISILILFAHLCLGFPSGLCPSSFPTKTLYTPLSSPISATCPSHLIFLDFITRTILGSSPPGNIFLPVFNWVFPFKPPHVTRRSTKRECSSKVTQTNAIMPTCTSWLSLWTFLIRKISARMPQEC